MKVLFATSEMAPLAKTGGLGDVAGALPRALLGFGVDARVLMPAYRGTIERLEQPREIARFFVREQLFILHEGCLPDSSLRIWLLDCPVLYAREGDPYNDGNGQGWQDNAWRFGCFSEACAMLAMDRHGLNWRPDVVHCNDWPTGLVPAWLAYKPGAPPCLFTVHNLAYQGSFERKEFDALGLSVGLWSPAGVEFYGRLNFMKAGLRMADKLSTVSPTYAREICDPWNGEGMDGLLVERREDLVGIVNGIDEQTWSPSSDDYLEQRYGGTDFVAGKRAAKLTLQRELGLTEDPDIPLIGMIGRLVWQKGFDLAIDAADGFLGAPTQLAVLASGDRGLEQALARLVARWPGQVGLHSGYDEGLAHRIEAGADIFLMPSRYEPCGLNQMYSQRYGTVPVVHAVGGLRDTVVDATPENLAAGRATGVHFEHADIGGVAYGVCRALELFRDPSAWSSMQRVGMAGDFSWQASAKRYLALYAQLIKSRTRR